MLEKYSVRTDLALEAKEKFEEEHAEVRGVVVKEDYNEEKDIRLQRSSLRRRTGRKPWEDPRVSIITLEAPICLCR